MKKIVVLLFAAVLFNCGGADSTDDGTDSTDIVENDAGGDAEDPEFTDGDTDVGADSPDENTDVGEDWLPETEDLVDCPAGCACCADYDAEETCACLKWPQTVEYMWLSTTWKCAEYDYGSCPGEIFVDITITAWNDELGAEVQEFPPYGPPLPYLYFKKNAETGQFEAINPETKQVVGSGTPLKVEYDSSVEVGVTHHAVWAKIE